MSGNHVSHAHNLTRRRWKPNLQTIRIIDENGTIRKVKVCARYIKAGKFTKAPRNKKVQTEVS